jgi:hypothetical protein
MLGRRGFAEIAMCNITTYTSRRAIATEHSPSFMASYLRPSFILLITLDVIVFFCRSPLS